MIYASGSSTSRSSSIWITSKGRIGTRAGSGSRQTRLAAAAAPPRKPSLILGFIGMVLVVIISWIVVANLIPPIAHAIPNPRQAATFQKFSPLLMLALPILIFFIWVIRHRMKKKRYLPRLAAWNETWACLKCGATWIQ
jgi:hypothetical protein